MKNDILLTVIIPAYNCESYIAECLDSVLDQLPCDCELIVVDDGSEDGTRMVLASYEHRQINLKVLFEPHRGASGARNAGLDAAKGEYVAFLDCDDCLKAGFLKQALPLTAKGEDLYIFGIEHTLLGGQREEKLLKDQEYPDVSAFANDYIRKRKLLIYSNCNKFYKRNVIEMLGLRFDEQTVFGEDRLFNYCFLEGCGAVRISSLVMLEYLQRSMQSMSSRHIPYYFACVMRLHQAKMDCFLKLARGLSKEELESFEAYDLAKEVEMTKTRFSAHPEEENENLPLIQAVLDARKI